MTMGTTWEQQEIAMGPSKRNVIGTWECENKTCPNNHFLTHNLLVLEDYITY
jgi:hypothetical protein